MTSARDPIPAPSRLARRLGLGDAAVVGLGSMLGAGVFAAFAPAAEAAGNGLLIGLAPAPGVWRWRSRCRSSRCSAGSRCCSSVGWCERFGRAVAYPPAARDPGERVGGVAGEREAVAVYELEVTDLAEADQ